MIRNLELPLVAFTVLSQLAVGLTLLYLLQTNLGPANLRSQPVPGSKRLWIAAGALLSAGLVASLLHLGHPLKAPRALTNLATSWLSREALLCSLLVFLMGATAYFGVRRPLVMVSAVLGFVVLFVQGMVYSPPSFPAL